MALSHDTYKKRRAALAEQVAHPILLLGALENTQSHFYQESSFYYFTGIEEPGLACLIIPGKEELLFVPEYAQSRAQWVGQTLEPNAEVAQHFLFDQAIPLGQPCPSYHLLYFSPFACWEKLCVALKELIDANVKIGTICQNELLVRFFAEMPELKAACIDIMPHIAAMRRHKEEQEAAFVVDALGETAFVLARAIEASVFPGIPEEAVLGTIEYTMTCRGTRPAFPAIVAAGKNGTIMHHRSSARPLCKSDCVIIDLGAAVNHMCCDITRTIPVSGRFTERQKQVYTAVLDTQKAVGKLARPGMYLSNPDEPEKSLNHIAKKMLTDFGLGDYVVHGIGHFLGLDVHDVGDPKTPLKHGDLLAIEPGVYIPEEHFGIRIEDNYWITDEETICLSEGITREVEAIEQYVQEEIRRLGPIPASSCSSSCCQQG